jgi:lipoprotein signal peptidase
MLRPAALVVVFGTALAADLLSKEWAVSSHAADLFFNTRGADLPLRVAAAIATVAVTFALARLAALRGLGRQWGLWLGCALVVAGMLGNGVSPLLWSQGVPDFIAVGGGWVWNVADFEIALGLSGGIGSVGVCAVRLYARDLAARRRAARRVADA